MAIACEFLSVLIPIKSIDTHFPGGFVAFEKEYEHLCGRPPQSDGHLVREGAMSPVDVEEIVRYWQQKGCTTIESLPDGSKKWKDLCVVEAIFGGPTLPCDWIEFSSRDRCAWLKCEPQGEIA
jgi:hypothetical protein